MAARPLPCLCASRRWPAYRDHCALSAGSAARAGCTAATLMSGAVSEQSRTLSRGLLFGLGAYASWGLFPAFFPLLKPAGAFEVLAHRILWTLAFMVVLVAVTGRCGDLR